MENERPTDDFDRDCSARKDDCLMYGYLKPDTASTKPALRYRYRRYYCGLCHSLWNHYGLLPRLMVSYDMTFAAVVLSSRFSLPAGRNRCLIKTSLPEPEESWKKLAALTVILAAGKLDDDIADDRSPAAWLARILFYRPIRKAMRDYPDADRAVKEKMARFHRLESEKRDVRTLSDGFSQVIAEGVRTLFPDLSAKEQSILRYVTGWIYFIDAVDDLDSDRRKGRPNPFLDLAFSREELLTRHEEEIRCFADEMTGKLRPVLRNEKPGTAEDMIIEAVINGTIPERTRRVFSLIPGGTRPPRRKGGVLYG